MQFQRGYSFDPQFESQVMFKDYVQMVKQEKFPGGVVLGDRKLGSKTIVKLLEDLELPSFYSDIAELEGFEIYQGTHFIDKSHYNKKEQILCLIDGHADVINVSPFYRQEIYVQPPFSQDSPVSFFQPDLKLFPDFNHARKDQIRLEKGDCLFVPAFNFYQVQAYNLDKVNFEKYGIGFDQESPTSEEKLVATMVAFQYQENSKLLNGFMSAVEQGLLK